MRAIRNGSFEGRFFLLCAASSGRLPAFCNVGRALPAVAPSNEQKRPPNAQKLFTAIRARHCGPLIRPGFEKLYHFLRIPARCGYLILRQIKHMIVKRNRAKEEFWNVMTHGLGALLSVIAAVLMVAYSALNGSFIDIAASGTFGLTLILLYGASTLYHANTRLRWKRLFQQIDHLCIYLLIAGTYTPVALLGLKGTWGWILFGMSWAFVVAGFIFKFSPLRHSDKLSLILYGLMGWMAILVLKPLLETVAPGALWFILAGGLCYTAGIYFYAQHNKPYFHAIWHVFVLAGSACHFFGIFLFLIP